MNSIALRVRALDFWLGEKFGHRSVSNEKLMEQKMKNIQGIDVQSLEEKKGHLELNGEIIATKTISWGWTKFYATPKGDGFGTIRNTGFSYFESEDAFILEAGQE